MAKFKPGDVVIYGEDIWAPPSDGIIDREENGTCYLLAFRHFAGTYNGKWRMTSSDGPISHDRNPRLHPTADEVWADFCKWKLTNASD